MGHSSQKRFFFPGGCFRWIYVITVKFFRWKVAL